MGFDWEIDWEQATVWAEYNGPGFDGLQIEVRYLYPDKAAEFLQESTTSKIKHGKVTEKLDGVKHERLVYDWMIKSWNLTDKDGNDVPCTVENKVKLCGRHKVIDQLVTDIALDEEKFLAKFGKEEALAKN